MISNKLLIKDKEILAKIISDALEEDIKILNIINDTKENKIRVIVINNNYQLIEVSLSFYIK